MSTDVDVIVVGGGAGGLVAALAAHDAGASAVVLEKLDRPGGNSALSTGSIPGAGTRWQQAAGIDDDPERMTADLLRQSGPHEAEHLTRRLAAASAELVEWLVDRHRIDLQLITDYKHVGHSVPRLHAPASRKGDALVRDLVAACGRAGVEIVPNSPVQQLLSDGEPPADRVIGVVIEGERTARYDLHASAVVLAANGYAANHDLMLRWAPDVADAEYFGAHGSTGEAIGWGEQLGGQLANIAAYQGYAAISYPHGSLLSWTTIEKGGLLLDRTGHRFGDESIGYSGFTEPVLAARRPVVAVFDTRIRDSAAEHEEEFRELVELGGTRECADAAAIAAFVDCPAESVTRTLADFDAAASGRQADSWGRRDFGRAPLRAPYVAARVVPGVFHTQGGLQVDDRARVVRGDGSTIEGLYAIGGTAAGISGRSGGRGYSSGSGLLSAVGLGAIAGADAADRRAG